MLKGEPKPRRTQPSLRETVRRDPVRLVPRPLPPFLRAVQRRIEAEREQRLAQKGGERG